MLDSMALPPGKTCADCGHFKRICSGLIGPEIADNDHCDFAPSRFYPAPSLPAQPDKPVK
jgi:hypothetical protein